MTKDTSKKSKVISKLELVFKYLALSVSIFLILNSIIAIILGVLHFAETILMLAQKHEGSPGGSIIESIDTFLFSLVILVLGGGIFKLFVGDENTFKNSTVFSKLDSFKDLKILLWETILLTLTVWCALDFLLEPKELDYKLLILPVTIVLLAFALSFIKKGSQH